MPSDYATKQVYRILFTDACLGERKLIEILNYWCLKDALALKQDDILNLCGVDI